MAVTTDGRLSVMTAAADVISGVGKYRSISLVGTGMTPAQRLILKDGSGKVIVDHYILNANENVEFVQGPHRTVRDLTWDTKPAGGSCTITADSL